MEYYSVIKNKNKILAFATTWVNLKDLMLREPSTERELLHLYIEPKKADLIK
jgi:hypothetical protein